MPKHAHKTTIEIDLAKLADLPRDELSLNWFHRTGHPSPKGCGRGLLELAEAYAIQTQAFGGLKPSLRRKLEARPNGAAALKIQKSRRLAQGVKLVRERNGRTHQIDVVQGGFMWNGNKHLSLSAIAKQITGAHWSGPRFFGL